MNKDAINQRIQALETELAGLKAELTKPEKFEFNYSSGNLFRIYAEQIDKNMNVFKAGRENFRYRQTETNAQADFQLQKELMCIGALAEQIDPDYKSKIDIEKLGPCCYIYYSKESKEYRYSTEIFTRTLGVVYMTQDVAEKVCEILNNKQVEL